jgi:hypothetical protein
MNRRRRRESRDSPEDASSPGSRRASKRQATDDKDRLTRTRTEDGSAQDYFTPSDATSVSQPGPAQQYYTSNQDELTATKARDASAISYSDPMPVQANPQIQFFARLIKSTPDPDDEQVL